jgi:hypothetical protein
MNVHRDGVSRERSHLQLFRKSRRQVDAAEALRIGGELQAASHSLFSKGYSIARAASWSLVLSERVGELFNVEGACGSDAGFEEADPTK